MNTVYSFFGGKKFFFSFFVFAVGTAMRFLDRLSEDGWIFIAVFAAGAYGILNVANKAVRAFGRNEE